MGKELKWWPDLESNQGHEDFQSSALPTELSGHQQPRIRRDHRPEVKLIIPVYSPRLVRNRHQKRTFPSLVQETCGV